MIPLMEDKRADVTVLRERYGVERLDIFGSAAGDGFDPERSDLDFVVSCERRDPQDLFRRYFGLEEDLEELFGRNVDLVMEGALEKSPRFADVVEGSREPLYGTRKTGPQSVGGHPGLRVLRRRGG